MDKPWTLSKTRAMYAAAQWMVGIHQNSTSARACWNQNASSSISSFSGRRPCSLYFKALDDATFFATGRLSLPILFSRRIWTELLRPVVSGVWLHAAMTGRWANMQRVNFLTRRTASSLLVRDSLRVARFLTRCSLSIEHREKVLFFVRCSIFFK